MINKFLQKHAGGLSGKTVVMTGCTGGIGKELCRDILSLGGSLIMLDRNPLKSETLERELKTEFPVAELRRITVDMQNTESVKSACKVLKTQNIDILIHNAGAYKIPREICSCGYDNVFTINFVSPYYITKQLADRVERVVVVGSIAHNYSKTDPADIDFKTRSASSFVYGNAKRYLMYSHFELLKNHKASLAVTHPGITLTGITSHYPKWLYIFIKPLMRLLFMKPKYAALSILSGLFSETEPYSWIGPAFFGIWGGPKKRPLKTAKPFEIARIYETAEEIYKML